MFKETIKKLYIKHKIKGIKHNDKRTGFINIKAPKFDTPEEIEVKHRGAHIIYN